MSEEKRKKLIEEEQQLLIKKDELFYDKVITEDKLKKINNEIKKTINNKQTYKETKNEVIKQYLLNLIKLSSISVGLSIPSYLLKKYSDPINGIDIYDKFIIFIFVFGSGILSADLINSINNELVDEYENIDFDEKINSLAIEREETEIKLGKIKEAFYSIIYELDELYSSMIPKEVKQKKLIKD